MEWLRVALHIMICFAPGSSYLQSAWLQTGQPGFDPRKRQRIFPLASVSEQAEASYPMGTTRPFAWVNLGQGVTETTQVVLRSRMSKS
jgi:hypothetical protein